MTISSDKKIWTDEEFMALPDDDDRYELIDGELVNVGHSGMEHGNIGSGSWFTTLPNPIDCSS